MTDHTSCHFILFISLRTQFATQKQKKMIRTAHYIISRSATDENIQMLCCMNEDVSGMRRPFAIHQTEACAFHSSHVVPSHSFVKITHFNFNNFDIIIKRLSVASDYDTGGGIPLWHFTSVCVWQQQKRD